MKLGAPEDRSSVFSSKDSQDSQLNPTSPAEEAKTENLQVPHPHTKEHISYNFKKLLGIILLVLGIFSLLAIGYMWYSSWKISQIDKKVNFDLSIEEKANKADPKDIAVSAQFKKKAYQKGFDKSVKMPSVISQAKVVKVQDLPESIQELLKSGKNIEVKQVNFSEGKKGFNVTFFESKHFEQYVKNLNFSLELKYIIGFTNNEKTTYVARMTLKDFDIEFYASKLLEDLTKVEISLFK